MGKSRIVPFSVIIVIMLMLMTMTVMMMMLVTIPQVRVSTTMLRTTKERFGTMVVTLSAFVRMPHWETTNAPQSE